MTEPTVSITISKSGGDLVLSGTPGVGNYGITHYEPPALQQRTVYMQDSSSVHGSEAVAQAWQQALLTFDWMPDAATSESSVATAYAAVVAAISQFSYTVTTQVSGATAEVWKADGGSIALTGGSREYADLANHHPVYTVTIPVYPVAS